MQGKDIARNGHCKERTLQGKENARKENAGKGQCKERKMQGKTMQGKDNTRKVLN